MIRKIVVVRKSIETNCQGLALGKGEAESKRRAERRLAHGSASRAKTVIYCSKYGSIVLKFTVLFVCVRGTYLVGPSRGKDSFLEDWGGDLV